MTNQQPPQNVVPDHRFQEMQEQLRKSMDQIQQLQGTINYMAQQSKAPTAPASPDPADQVFKPEVNEAIDKRIQRQLQQETQKYANGFNVLAEQNDNLKFQVQFGPDTYKKYAPQIENLRQQRQGTGQPWISREEAYKQIYFEENSKKPRETPLTAQAIAPTFNPYTQSWETPQAPVAPGQQPVQAAPAQQPPVQTAPPLDVLPQVQTQPVQTYQAPRQEDFGLPPQDMPAPGSSAAGTDQRGQVLDITTDEKALDAWAQKYENVNF